MNKIKGFTLVELLVVLAITAILATVIVFNFAGASERAKTAKAQTDLSAMKNAASALHSASGELMYHCDPNTCRCSSTIGWDHYALAPGVSFLTRTVYLLMTDIRIGVVLT